MSVPTISDQRVTSSVEANPCLANASVKVLCRRSERGRNFDLPGLFMELGSATWATHDGSSAHCAGKESSRSPAGAQRYDPLEPCAEFAGRCRSAPALV